MFMLAIVFAAASAMVAGPTLNNGACLDSGRSVPQGLFGTDSTAAIVRIDKVVSTTSMIDGETIGYLYTRQDGTQWLGQRKQQYASAAASAAINTLFASIHMPNAAITQFPPTRLYGVKTNYTEIFQVHLAQSALDPLHVRLDPCVAWPAAMALPNPLP